MRPRWLWCAVASVALVGCGAGTPTPVPAESIPPPPTARDGWQSIVSFGGSGPGAVGASTEIAEGAVAVHASCVGGDTLVVMLATSAPTAGQGIAAPAAVFDCGEAGETVTSRVELEGVPIGEVIASAFVAEGAGSTRHAAFNVSIEQPSDAADD